MITSDLRSYFDAELHTRPFMQLGTNQRIFHFAMHCGETDPVRAWKYFNKVISPAFKIKSPKTTGRFHINSSDEMTIRYERHTEFISLGIFYHDAVDPDAMFDPEAPGRLPAELVTKAPGPIISATWIEMIPGNRPLTPEEASAIIGQENVAASQVSEQGTQTYNAFKLDQHPFLKHGFNRVFVQNNGLGSRQTGRLSQRLIELEVYRQFALLGLPMVRDLQGELSGLEHDIAAITHLMDHEEEDDNPDRFDHEMDQLTSIMARIERISAQSSYRLAASMAYQAIADRRILELREQRLKGFQTLHDFLDRRLSPAIRTCSAFQSRLDNLAVRAQRSNTLLRTRIDMRIQKQNNDLLKSMESRARAQLQLQETVELLSVAAITYYMVSLISYVLGGIKSITVIKPVILSIAVPVIAFTLYGLIRLVRRKLKHKGDQNKS